MGDGGWVRGGGVLRGHAGSREWPSLAPSEPRPFDGRETLPLTSHPSHRVRRWGRGWSRPTHVTHDRGGVTIATRGRHTTLPGPEHHSNKGPRQERGWDLDGCRRAESPVSGVHTPCFRSEVPVRLKPSRLE